MSRDRTVASTEYAVEVNNEKGFVRQIETFPTYEEAEAFTKNNDVKLGESEYLNIIYIDYNADGDEVGFGTVC